MQLKRSWRTKFCRIIMSILNKIRLTLLFRHVKKSKRQGRRVKSGGRTQFIVSRAVLFHYLKMKRENGTVNITNNELVRLHDKSPTHQIESVIKYDVWLKMWLFFCVYLYKVVSNVVENIIHNFILCLQTSICLLQS